jgi:ankyrin repeat protein
MAIGFDRMLMVGETRADLRGTTWPLDVAVRQGRLDMVKLLLANGAKLHGRELPEAAFIELQNDSLAMVTTLLEAGANANSRSDGSTALLRASYRGNKKTVKLLLAQPGIKLDETDYDGRTALMWAAELGHAEIVEMLLQAGANTSIISKRDGTAMALAQKTLKRQQAIVEKQQAIISRLQSPTK